MKEITVSVTLIHRFNFNKMKYDVQEYSTAVMNSFPRPELSHLRENTSNFFLVIKYLYCENYLSSVTHMYEIHLELLSDQSSNFKQI